MDEKKFWKATYADGLMPETTVLAEDEAGARKAAYAVYAYNSGMQLNMRPVEDVVRSVRPDLRAKGYSGVMRQPCSERPPEAPVVNAEGFTMAVREKDGSLREPSAAV